MIFRPLFSEHIQCKNSSFFLKQNQTIFLQKKKKNFTYSKCSFSGLTLDTYSTVSNGYYKNELNSFNFAFNNLKPSPHFLLSSLWVDPLCRKTIQMRDCQRFALLKPLCVANATLHRLRREASAVGAQRAPFQLEVFDLHTNCVPKLPIPVRNFGRWALKPIPSLVWSSKSSNWRSKAALDPPSGVRLYPLYCAFKPNFFYKIPVTGSSPLNKQGAAKQNEKIILKSLPKNTNEKSFWNQTFDKSRLKNFVLWFLSKHGEYKTVKLVEELKTLGFQYATKAGISLGIEDLKIPIKKNNLIMEAEQLSIDTIKQYKRSEITGVERFQRLIDTWHRTSERLKQEVIENFEATDILNPVYMMAFSGARGNISQVRQLVGMRGLMSNPQGQIIDFPIRSNFREGLTLTEYIISSYGARKGIVDTALRTANAGYLTRRLVDVAQHVIISNFDCGSKRGIFLNDMKEGNKTIYSLQNRLIGRVLARDVYSKNSLALAKQPTGAKPFDLPMMKIIKVASRNVEISAELAISLASICKKVFVRSALTCQTKNLVCQLCYGWSLAQGNLVGIGEAVGVVAAQSIGEPGTQLTMRTFHTGGVFSGDVSDQIRASFNGIVTYDNPIAGTLIRTPEGKIAFLTKNEGSFKVQSISSLNQKSLGFAEIKKFKIPFYTLLFFKNGEKVLEKEVIAQISSINRQKSATDQAEFTINAELSGQFFSKFLNLKENKVGPKLKGSLAYKSYNPDYFSIIKNFPGGDLTPQSDSNDASRPQLEVKDLHTGQGYAPYRRGETTPTENNSLVLPDSELVDIQSRPRASEGHSMGAFTESAVQSIGNKIFENKKKSSGGFSGIDNLKSNKKIKKQEILVEQFDENIVDTIFESWGWGYAWVLSGKIYQLPLASTFFPIIGDFVNNKTYMNKNQLSLPSNFGSALKLNIQFPNSAGHNIFFNKKVIKQMRLFSPVNLTKDHTRFLKKNLNTTFSFGSQKFLPKISGAVKTPLNNTSSPLKGFFSDDKTLIKKSLTPQSDSNDVSRPQLEVKDLHTSEGSAPYPVNYFDNAREKRNNFVKVKSMIGNTVVKKNSTSSLNSLSYNQKNFSLLKTELISFQLSKIIYQKIGYFIKLNSNYLSSSSLVESSNFYDKKYSIKISHNASKSSILSEDDNLFSSLINFSKIKYPNQFRQITTGQNFKEITSSNSFLEESRSHFDKNKFLYPANWPIKKTFDIFLNWFPKRFSTKSGGLILLEPVILTNLHKMKITSYYKGISKKINFSLALAKQPAGAQYTSKISSKYFIKNFNFFIPSKGRPFKKESNFFNSSTATHGKLNQNIKFFPTFFKRDLINEQENQNKTSLSYRQPGIKSFISHKSSPISLINSPSYPSSKEQSSLAPVGPAREISLNLPGVSEATRKGENKLKQPISLVFEQYQLKDFSKNLSAELLNHNLLDLLGFKEIQTKKTNIISYLQPSNFIESEDLNKSQNQNKNTLQVSGNLKIKSQNFMSISHLNWKNSFKINFLETSALNSNYKAISYNKQKIESLQRIFWLPQFFYTFSFEKFIFLKQISSKNSNNFISSLALAKQPAGATILNLLTLNPYEIISNSSLINQIGFYSDANIEFIQINRQGKIKNFKLIQGILEIIALNFSNLTHKYLESKTLTNPKENLKKKTLGIQLKNKISTNLVIKNKKSMKLTNSLCFSNDAKRRQLEVFDKGSSTPNLLGCRGTQPSLHTGGLLRYRNREKYNYETLRSFSKTTSFPYFLKQNSVKKTYKFLSNLPTYMKNKSHLNRKVSLSNNPLVAYHKGNADLNKLKQLSVPGVREATRKGAKIIKKTTNLKKLISFSFAPVGNGHSPNLSREAALGPARESSLKISLFNFNFYNFFNKQEATVYSSRFIKNQQKQKINHICSPYLKNQIKDKYSSLNSQIKIISKLSTNILIEQRKKDFQIWLKKFTINLNSIVKNYLKNNLKAYFGEGVVTSKLNILNYNKLLFSKKRARYPRYGLQEKIQTKNKKLSFKIKNQALDFQNTKTKSTLPKLGDSLNLIAKPGWLYFTNDISKFFLYHKKLIQPGKTIANDFIFDSQHVYLEILDLNSSFDISRENLKNSQLYFSNDFSLEYKLDKTEKNSLPRWVASLTQGKKIIKNKRCRFLPNNFNAYTCNKINQISHKPCVKPCINYKEINPVIDRNPISFISPKIKENIFLILIRTANEYKLFNDSDYKKEIYRIANEKNTNLNFSLKSSFNLKSPIFHSNKKILSFHNTFHQKNKSQNIFLKINNGTNTFNLWGQFKTSLLNKQKLSSQTLAKFPSPDLNVFSNISFYSSLITLKQKLTKNSIFYQSQKLFSSLDPLNLSIEGINVGILKTNLSENINNNFALTTQSVASWRSLTSIPVGSFANARDQINFLKAPGKTLIQKNELVSNQNLSKYPQFLMSYSSNIFWKYNPITAISPINFSPLIISSEIPYSFDFLFKEPIRFFSEQKNLKLIFARRSFFSTKSSMYKDETNFSRSSDINFSRGTWSKPIKKLLNNYLYKINNLKKNSEIDPYQASLFSQVSLEYPNKAKVTPILSSLFFSPIAEYSLSTNFEKSILYPNNLTTFYPIQNTNLFSANINNIYNRNFLISSEAKDIFKTRPQLIGSKSFPLVLGSLNNFLDFRPKYRINKEIFLYKTEFESFNNNEISSLSTSSFINTYTYCSFEGELIFKTLGSHGKISTNHKSLDNKKQDSVHTNILQKNISQEKDSRFSKFSSLLSKQSKVNKKLKDKLAKLKSDKITSDIYSTGSYSSEFYAKNSENALKNLENSLFLNKRLVDSCMILTKKDQLSYYLNKQFKNSLFPNNTIYPIQEKNFTYKQIYYSLETIKNKNKYLINDTIIKFLNILENVDTPNILPTVPEIANQENISNKDQDLNNLKNQNDPFYELNFKLNKLPIGLSQQTNSLLLGEFLVYGDRINPYLAVTKPGQIIHINDKKITMRFGQPIFVSPKAILHKYDNDFIEEQSPVITLSYQQLKTGDIIQGIPKVEQFFEARTTKRGRLFRDSLSNLLKALFKRYSSKGQPFDQAVRQSFYKIQQIIVDGVQRVYRSQGVSIADKHLEVIVKQMTSKVRILEGGQTGFFPGEVVDLILVEEVNNLLMKKITYEPLVLGITKASLEVDSFLSAASFQQTTKVLTNAAISKKKDFLKGLKENVILGNLIPAGTGYLVYLNK